MIGATLFPFRLKSRLPAAVRTFAPSLLLGGSLLTWALMAGAATSSVVTVQVLSAPGARIIAGPDLTIDKRHTAQFTVGQPGLYQLIVRNIGTGSTAGSITVNDTLPSG